MREEFYSRLVDIVSREQEIFKTLEVNGDWNDIKWEVKKWLFHRGTDDTLSFNVYKVRTSDPSSKMSEEFGDFTKSMAVFLNRTKGSGYMAIRNYVNACRQLFAVMKLRNEPRVQQLTRWHFDEVINNLKKSGYKKLYEAATNLKVIADLIDKFYLTPVPIQYVNNEVNNHKYHDHKSLVSISSEDERIGEDKLPSYEAMAAYAFCTNNPINEDEEILLRTIDLLIAMGQRGNEITHIPYDCIVEHIKTNPDGSPMLDTKGNQLKDIGIRYFAEKQFQSGVHWLAEQDIPFALRAINKLKKLTKPIREVAVYQEKNNRLWNLNPNSNISDIDLIKEYLGFENTHNLFLYLKTNKIGPKLVNKAIRHEYGVTSIRKWPEHYYNVQDIERFLFPKLDRHIILRENDRIILKTSELLSIRFEGAFRFKRKANTFKVLPGKLKLMELNGALGSIPGLESIFERRGLTEADGSKIKMTSHQPRHWRNTLYELAGMSNVNQALSLGRKLIEQNTAYQHGTVKEITQVHKDFLTFNSTQEKISFLRTGIRESKIIGDLTDTYHTLKQFEGVDSAEAFLATHANALHITPFGACSHDFSLTPCPKHLQCWNGCSNLNLTGSGHEMENLNLLISKTEMAISKMRENADGEFGGINWVEDIEKKLANMKIAYKLATKKQNGTIFKNGQDLSGTKKKSSSV